MSILDDVKARLDDETDYAYADFNEYKREVLLSEEDEEPFDDFRYGMRRALEIVNIMLQDAIIIPKNATNGDMIKAIYPNNKFEVDTFWNMVDTTFTGKEYEHHLAFPIKWWNAPYKKGE